jgi:hypothetical protein
VEHDGLAHFDSMESLSVRMTSNKALAGNRRHTHPLDSYDCTAGWQEFRRAKIAPGDSF